MQLQKQNKPQCLAYAFAMAMNVPAEELIQDIGHDGLAIQWPEAVGDKKHIGFHHQEIIDVALLKGFNIIMIEAMPNLGYNGQQCIVGGNHEARINTYLQAFSGVLTSDKHAVAWDHNEQKCYDPNGYVYGIDNFQIREFFLVVRGNYEDSERLRWTILRARPAATTGSGSVRPICKQATLW